MSPTSNPDKSRRSYQRPSNTEERLSALEVRVTALEDAGLAPHEQGTLWVVDGLKQQPSHSPAGSVIFGGDVKTAGKDLAYQWQRPTEALVSPDTWDSNVERLLALAHPVRLNILRRLLDSPAQVAEFVEEELVTSTSTAYHHLSALTQAGWISKSASGGYEIAPRRVIALLTIISASEDH